MAKDIPNIEFFFPSRNIRYHCDEILSSTLPSNNDVENSVFNIVRKWYAEINEFQFHTSGSTGTPKKISISKKQMRASALLTKQALNLYQGQNALLCMDPKYIGGCMMVVRALITGMNLVCIEPMANPLQGFQIDKIDFAAFVPYQVQAILQDKNTKKILNNFGTVIIGGAPLSETTRKELSQLNCVAYETYGMTETISHIALMPIKGENKIFTILPKIKIKTDSRGCLVIEAPLLSDKQIITNDCVEIVKESSFIWLGRFDQVINSGGIKIHPEILEKKIAPHLQLFPSIKSFFIGGLPDLQLGEKIVLILEIPKAETAITNHIQIKLKAVLDRFECPREIIALPFFPFTPGNKIDRRKIMESINRQKS